MLRRLSLLPLLLILMLAACGGAAQTADNAPAAQDVLVADREIPVFENTIPDPVSQDVLVRADARHRLLAEMYENLAPSVVFIEVVETTGSVSSGNGSGFVYDLNGHVITNAHVINTALEVRVKFHDDYVAEAEIVGIDTNTDLAVLRVNTTVERLHPLTMGDSRAIRVGEPAVVIGNPFGLSSSMTTGIISGTNRDLPSAFLIEGQGTDSDRNPDIIQVDADINPGNSGGPLLNAAGEVIGVTTAIRTETGIFEGVGFAVPTSTVERVVPELIETGSAENSWQELIAEAAAQSNPAAGPIPVAQAQPTPLPEALIEDVSAEHLLLSNLYERLARSVVYVEVIVQNDNGGLTAQDVGNGSGFIYDEEGHIITNAHVVALAEEIRVTFNDGYVTDAEVVGFDTYSDLAVIKIDVDPTRLNPIPLGDSDLARVGERAIVIGNPFGLASSMTTGIISAKGRQLPSAQLIDAAAVPGFQNPSIIQVDADINPGNSGGPLLNSQGEAIGVTTAIRTETGIFEGVGFAVPSSTVRRVVPELIENGIVDYAWIGISAMSSSDGFGVSSLAEPLNLPVNYGVLLSTVTPGSPAANAGLLGGYEIEVVRGREICAGGDIIIAVDETPIRTMDELVTYLVTNNRPGDVINVEIIRDREPMVIPVTLEARPTGQLPPSFCGEE